MKKQLLSFCVSGLLAFSAQAQWSSLGTGTANGCNNDVLAFAIDTAKNELYCGGDFTMAGGVTNNRVAKWDGTNWSSLGTGMDGSVNALCYFNGEIYAGGQFFMAGGNVCRNIAKWNGTNWVALATGFNSAVYSLAVYNGELYAGGVFTGPGSGSGTIKRLAKWTGSAWQQVGLGVDNSYIASMLQFGNDLFIGGQNLQVNGVNQGSVIKWNGTALSTAGGTANVNTVNDFDIHLGELYCTAVTLSSNTKPAKWNGTNWVDMTVGLGPTGIYAIHTYNFKLHVGTNNNSRPCLFSWTGSTWPNVDGGIRNTGVISDDVQALITYKNELYAGGTFKFVGTSNVAANYVARWNAGTTTIDPALSVEAAIYPNPASDLVTVKLKKGDISLLPVSVCDLSGRQVEVLKLAGADPNTLEIDISELASGVYLLNIQTPQGPVSRKLIKE